jgi:hypothetical protein
LGLTPPETQPARCRCNQRLARPGRRRHVDESGEPAGPEERQRPAQRTAGGRLSPPVRGTTSDARIMARLACRYGDMTQSRLTCPVIHSGERATCGTARLGREPTTYRLICAHDSDAAYSHLTRRTTVRCASPTAVAWATGIAGPGARFPIGRGAVTYLVPACGPRSPVLKVVNRSTASDLGRLLI